MAIEYRFIPTQRTWATDSSVTLATRANDPVLLRIDQLVDAYNKAADDGVRVYVVSDLFFTLDYWLKVYKTTPKMEKGREPAIMALYKFVVDHLGELFSPMFPAPRGVNRVGAITPNNLSTALEMFFGRTLSKRGAMLDLRLDCAEYLERADVHKYRLIFKNGKAYQFPWWRNNARASAVELAESSHAEDPAIFGAGRAGWAGFAMSMGRDLYMAKHRYDEDAPPGANVNFYHSSYLGGQPVLCAGTVLIEDGVIRGIATDSGHYLPDTLHIVNVLQALQMHGVNPATINVEDHDGVFQADGATFLANNGNWAGVVSRRRANQAHIQARRVDEKAFGDALKHMWEQGIQGGFYKDDIKSKVFFVSHVLPLTDKITVGGKNFRTSGLNFLYALDAIAKATSRAANPLADFDDWLVDQWRAYLKGDTHTMQDGARNRKENVPAFAAWLKPKYPEFAGWTKEEIEIASNDALKKKGHRFDDDEVSSAAKKMRANAGK